MINRFGGFDVKLQVLHSIIHNSVCNVYANVAIALSIMLILPITTATMLFFIFYFINKND